MSEVQHDIHFENYFIITGGTIGYMEMRAADGMTWCEIAEQVRSYNRKQDELVTGCKMHYESRKIDTLTYRY